MKPFEPVTQLPESVPPAPLIATNDDNGFVFCYLCGSVIGGPFVCQTVLDAFVVRHMKEAHDVRLAYAQDQRTQVYRVPPKNSKP